MSTIRLIPPLLAALLAAACSSTPPTASPETIALTWCNSNRPGDQACLATAEEAHRQCIVAPGRYDDCRARLLGTPQNANPR
ncbi:hypothetical protein [Arenibaculum pallidiluteum]|uniref:hypothetical protein n=1 Tax=Arenibaculum pallidiluteum TaxID=2812559 RepID=UPI001A96DED7|nr:hypothetical protein [Arenibaculum pallidiluteum]